MNCFASVPGFPTFAAHTLSNACSCSSLHIFLPIKTEQKIGPYVPDIFQKFVRNSQKHRNHKNSPPKKGNMQKHTKSDNNCGWGTFQATLEQKFLETCQSFIPPFFFQIFQGVENLGPIGQRGQGFFFNTLKKNKGIFAGGSFSLFFLEIFFFVLLTMVHTSLTWETVGRIKLSPKKKIDKKEG